MSLNKIWNWRKSLLITLVAFLIACGVLFSAENKNTQKDLTAISQYKKWRKANAKPKLVSSLLSLLCTSVPPERIKLETKNPHNDKYVVIYINDAGFSEYSSTNTSRYPEGTIIVKEKLPQPDANPELLTVMIKRKAGFDSGAGDWEFLAFDGTGKKILSRGEHSCQACHADAKYQDYVFRTDKL